jgi:hypothetical protein
MTDLSSVFFWIDGLAIATIELLEVEWVVLVEALAAEKLKTPEVIEVEFEAGDAEITGVKTQYVKMKHYYLRLFVF